MSYPSTFTGYWWYPTDRIVRSSYSYTLTNASCNISIFQKLAATETRRITKVGSSYSQTIYSDSDEANYLLFIVTGVKLWLNYGLVTLSDYILYFNSELINSDTTSLTKLKIDFGEAGIFMKAPNFYDAVYVGDLIITRVYFGINCETKYGLSQSATTAPTSWYSEDMYELLKAPSSAGTYYLWMAADADSGYNSFSGRPIGIVNVEALPEPSYTAPMWASNLTYTGGNLQVFYDGGSVSGGTMYYGLGSSTSSAPTSWKSDYQDVVVQSAGEYFLWYKIIGDSEHSDIPARYLHRVEVAKANQTFTFTTPVNITSDDIYELSPSGTYMGTWSTTVIDSSVCAASVVNNKLYITGIAAGTTRVDIKCSGNANFNERTVLVFVTVTAAYVKVYINGLYYKMKYYDGTSLKLIKSIKKGS